MEVKDYVSIAIPSQPRYLSLVRDFTAKWCGIQGINDDETDKIRLAIDEACSNIIKYAYRGDDSGIITARFSAFATGIRIIIEDTGLKAKPSAIHGRRLDDIRPGGLGIHLITRVFDSMTYDRRKRKGNRLILTRHAKRTA